MVPTCSESGTRAPADDAAAVLRARRTAGTAEVSEACSSGAGVQPLKCSIFLAQPCVPKRRHHQPVAPFGVEELGVPRQTAPSTMYMHISLWKLCFPTRRENPPRSDNILACSLRYFQSREATHTRLSILTNSHLHHLLITTPLPAGHSSAAADRPGPGAAALARAARRPGTPAPRSARTHGSAARLRRTPPAPAAALVCRAHTL